MSRAAGAVAGVTRVLAGSSPAFVLSLGLALGVAAPAVAQDIETAAAARGVPLPAAYYEQVRSDASAYEFSRALLRRGARPSGVDGPARAGVAGSVRVPVVLALFADSPTPHITREMVQAALFDGPAARGTLTEAYSEMSRGALLVGGDVLPWVRTEWSLAEVVGASQGLGNDGAVGPHFRDALDALDATVDFRVYDNDGPDGIADSGDDDGFVDVIALEYLEVEASCGGPSIWPHRWTLTARLGEPYGTNDVGVGGEAIRIDDYITQGVADCSGLQVQDASTLAHELGHAFGLPDYYHWIDRSAGARGRRWVLGCWELMAAGSWGCGPVEEPRAPFGPTHLSAHSKHRLGWLEYVDVGEVWNEEIFLDPVQTSAQALRVQLDPEGREFLIAEYRARVGFDAQLPADGVLLYKQDLDAGYQPSPASGAPYFLTVLERDGNAGLLRTDLEGGNRGEAGDAWGVAGSQELHFLTAPGLRTSDGTATPVTVHEVSVANGRARLVVSRSSTPRLIAPPGAPTVPASVRVAGGAMPYAATWFGPTGLSVSADGDDLVLAGGTGGGPLDLVLQVRDAAGADSEPLLASGGAWRTWTLEIGSLVAPLVDESASLSHAQRAYLDGLGNANGGFDVGDVRRWLRERRAGP